MGVYIRPYQVEDKAKLMIVIDTVCQECKWMETDRFRPTPAWKSAIDGDMQADYKIFLVEDNTNKDVIGWSRLFTKEPNNSPKQAELGIGILGPYRSQGIGTNLLKITCQWALTKAYDCVRLYVAKNNIIANRLFCKSGFLVIASVGERFLMEKLLNPAKNQQIGEQRVHYR